MKKTMMALALLAMLCSTALADTITAKEIAEGISDKKTELEQEAWWKENMDGKLHEFTGTVMEVEKGTFSGYWVKLNIGRDIRVMCGMSSKWDGHVQKLRKGQKFACKGYVASTWVALFGTVFEVDAG